MAMLEAAARSSAALVTFWALLIPPSMVTTSYVLCKSLLSLSSVVATRKNDEIIKIDPKLSVPFSPLWARQVPPSGLLSLKLSLQLCFHATISTPFTYRCNIRLGLSKAAEPTKYWPFTKVKWASNHWHLTAVGGSVLAVELLSN